MAPKEGNSIVKHGVLDERLNVHGVKGLKVADLSICPDNVGCNTYSTALLIGEKCAMLTAEDLGYSGRALDMRVPDYHAPRYVMHLNCGFEKDANNLTEKLLAWLVCRRECLESKGRRSRRCVVSDESYASLTRYDMYMTVMNVVLVSSCNSNSAVP